jgi:non-specific protein-tyrosine kinase
MIVAIAVVLGISAALALFMLRPPEYTARISLYVSAQTGDDPQQAYQGAQLSEQRVTSYNQLVIGDRVLGEAISRLGIRESTDELAKRVTATTPEDSVIINISATDSSPTRAAAIANTIGTVTTDVVAELERPTAPNGVPPVTVRVVQPAQTPAEPSSPGMLLLAVLGLCSGLAVGIGAAMLRHALDTSIKSVDQLAGTTESPNLGVIAYDSKTERRPLTVQDNPQSSRAEAFRQLRTNLQFIDVDNPRKVLLVTSSVAGEGKTTVVANLAVALSSTGTRTLVIEADLRRPKLSNLLGVDRQVGLTRVLSGRTSLATAVQPWGGGAFDILASGPTPPNPSELLSSNQMRALLDEARARYDVVLVDAPPLLPVTDAAAIAPATDGAVLVCRFRQSRQHVTAAVQALRAVSVEPLGTIFTMAPTNGPLANATYGTYYSSEAAKIVRPKTAPADRNASSRPGLDGTTNGQRLPSRGATSESTTPPVSAQWDRRSNRP